jgi:hypothetical protein
VLFLGHSAKKPLPRAALGKVLLSVMSSFTESRTLGTETHSAKPYLPSGEHSAKVALGKGGARQRALSGRLKLTDVSLCQYALYVFTL